MAIATAMIAALGVGSASPASAATRLTGAGVIKAYTGKSYGPNRYTQDGMATIKSFARNGNFYDANVKTVHIDPGFAAHSSTAGTATPAASDLPGVRVVRPGVLQADSSVPNGYVRAQDGTVHPNSWYNPFSWDWGHIFGTFWSKVVKPCLSGVSKGYVSTLGGTLASRMIIYLDGMSITPQGLAIVTIGSCVMGFSS